jgi:hypothetical protein
MTLTGVFEGYAQIEEFDPAESSIDTTDTPSSDPTTAYIPFVEMGMFFCFALVKLSIYILILHDLEPGDGKVETSGLSLFALSARCAFFDRNVHSRLPLDPTHVRVKQTCV